MTPESDENHGRERLNSRQVNTISVHREGAFRAEHGLAGAAEGRAHAGALAVLQEDDHDKKQADTDSASPLIFRKRRLREEFFSV